MAGGGAAVHFDSGNVHMHALIGGVAARGDDRVPVEIRRPHLEMLRTMGTERARQIAESYGRDGGMDGPEVSRRLFPPVMRSQQHSTNASKIAIQYSATPPYPPALAGLKKG